MKNNTFYSQNTPKILFVGTFPPTQEGISTFNDDLVTSVQKIVGKSAMCIVAAVNLKDTTPYYFDSRVTFEFDQDSPETYKNTVDEINKDDDIKCVVIQHEYGIYGSLWGEFVIDFINSLEKPILTLMHTVLETHHENPRKFKEVTDKLVERSNEIAVFSKASKATLSKMYPQFIDKFHFIPHGIHPVKFVLPKTVKKDMSLGDKTVLTTFGLLSRNKGIEYVIKALPKVVEKYPDVLYQVLGQTHPIIIRKEGELYRTELTNLVRELGLRRNVVFVDKFMSIDELLKYLQATDVYVATSLDKNQAVSGTFSYALGAGRAVVSTDFTQAQEMISKNTGILVPTKDPEAYAAAIIKLIEDKKRLSFIHRKAYERTRSMLWTNVSVLYINIIQKYLNNDRKLLLPEIDLTHLKKITKKYGVLQFSKYDIPLDEFGYTLDDNARALVAISWLTERGYLTENLKNLFRKYLRFIRISKNGNNKFRNYFDINMEPTDQNDKEMPEDPYGRAMFALSEVIVNHKFSVKSRNQAKKIWNDMFYEVDNLKFLRPKSLMVIAMTKIYKSESKSDHLLEFIVKFADELIQKYNETKTEERHWFEDELTYNNAILPEALAFAHKATGNKEYLKISIKAFSFLISTTFMGDVYIPIGQSKWFKKGGERSMYDQQPEDPCSMVLGLVTMYETTHNPKYIILAKRAFTWFLGNNLNGLPLYNYKNGGVYDGLKEDGVNKNQGAESLLSYIMARTRIEPYFK